MSVADYALQSNNPTPFVKEQHDPNVVFCIHRNKNKNVVVYAANRKEDGSLDPQEPLKVYWIMFEQSGCPREGLNLIERNSAYGVTVEPWEGRPGHFKVILTSLKDRVIDLYIDEATGKVVATGVLGNVENCTLERVFVSSTTSWGMPKVQFIIIQGHDPSGKEIEEKKVP